MISVDRGCEVWNVLCWQVSTEVETINPTYIIFIISTRSRDCEGPSVDRESEFIPHIANVPWVEYHVGMWHYHIHTVAIAASDVYDSHGSRCNG